jgi:hypothetical protein
MVFRRKRWRTHISSSHEFYFENKSQCSKFNSPTTLQFVICDLKSIWNLEFVICNL